LPGNIAKGYLLNDICFFVDKGLVELWPKQKATLDREAKTIELGGKVAHYDVIIDGDREEPNLPPITIGDSRRPYSYPYRENYLGVVPKEMHNVFLLGYTRPTTGGLSNIVEMQCLLAHKLITDPVFNRDMYGDIDRRIQKYNKYFCATPAAEKTDNLVYYG